MSITSRLEQVANAMTEWRHELINVDGSNRLLYYRDLKVGTLDLADAVPTALEQLRRGQAVRLGRLYPEKERLVTALKSVKRIAGMSRVAEEEYGVSISFLAIGMATWDDGRSSFDQSNNGHSNNVEEEPPGNLGLRMPASPVLLQPVGFVARPGSRDGYELKLSGEAIVNPVLLHVLSSQFQVVVDDSELLEAASDDGMLFRALEKSCSGVARFGINERLLIGTFSYMKQPMVDDLDEDQLEFLAESDLVAAIAGVPEAVELIRSQGGDASLTSPDYEPPANEFLVLDADASQSYVINAASAGQHLVVQGPPGTGKSQTIANLIADLAAHGKSVLFVAQKRAAITAVLQRLERVDLEHLAIDMFEGAGSRKHVMSAIGAAMETMSEARTVSADALHVRWTTARDQLTRHQMALHELREPWHTSVWGLMSMERGQPEAAKTVLRLKPKVIGDWTPLSVEELGGFAAELCAAGGFDASLIGRVGWGIDAFPDLESLATSYGYAEELDESVLPSVLTFVTEQAQVAGVETPCSVNQLRDLVTLLAKTVEYWRLSGRALSSDLADIDLTLAINANAPKEWLASKDIQIAWRERRTGRKIANTLLDKSLSKVMRHEYLVESRRLRDAWKNLGAPKVPELDSAGVTAGKTSERILMERIDRLQVKVDGVALAEVSFEELASVLKDLLGDPYRFRLPQIHGFRRRLIDAGLGDVLVEMSAQHVSGDVADAKVRYVFAVSLIEQILAKDERLAGVTRAQLERWAMEFVTADVQHLEANAARVRRIAAERMATIRNSYPDEDAAVHRQVIRKRGFISIRKLFLEAPNVLKAIKPCWAMSPLMVSQILPARRLFDVVIFDEASQVVPADAIPAIARGAQLLVAGDQHQLPPTNLWQKISVAGLDEDGDGGDDGDEDEDQSPNIAPATRDLESILDALALVLTGRTRTLTWHYRSKDEMLIATNNSYIYHNQLITFPGANGEGRVRYISVPPSPGLGRNNKSPSSEVSKVVDLALEHARDHPLESLGIITFGSDHMNRIEAELEARLKVATELQPFFQPSGFEPFFIKNIERVQGDEREAIILSLGYGKADDGRLRYSWGPVLNKGGERRPNVATSRAKSRMTLVTSFTADEMDPTASSSEGFQFMYRFIQFMNSHGQSFGGSPGRDVTLNPFEADVMHQLTAAGLQLEPQWGVGAYLIDFAVKDPDHPGRFVLAIECDGASYHSGVIARERDRLRQQHLELLGWRFHRIWSTDWRTDPAPQVEAVLVAYEAALAKARSAEEGIGEQSGAASNEGDKSDILNSTSAPKARVFMPLFTPGTPIARYRPIELVRIVRWVMSDDIIRTDEELLEEAVKEMGFAKRGSRIRLALIEAIVSAKAEAAAKRTQ